MHRQKLIANKTKAAYFFGGVAAMIVFSFAVTKLATYEHDNAGFGDYSFESPQGILEMKVHGSAAGGVESLTLITPSGGALVEYQSTGQYGRPSLYYSTVPVDNESAVIWKDLNLDGVFDVRYTPSGVYAFVDNKWVKGYINGRKFVRGDSVYKYDPGDGKWINQQKNAQRQ